MSNLSIPILGFMASFSACTQSCLRSDVVGASMVAGGYIAAKILKPVHALPWSLVVVDEAANLDALKAGSPPSEPIALKVYKLLHLGFSRSQLEAGLSLAEEASWSTAVTEQGHASASSMMKGHDQYSAGTMTSRAMLHMVKPLFAKDPAEKKSVAWMSKLRS